MKIKEYKIRRNVDFNFAELLYLKYLEKHKILNTHRITKQYNFLISKATASRAIKHLEKLGIIKRIGSSNYRAIHKRMVDAKDLGIITMPMTWNKTLQGDK